MSDKQRFTYATILTTESYLQGCLVLHESLMATGTAFPFLVVCPSDIPDSVTEALAQKNIQFLKLENLPAEVISRDNSNSYWNNTLFKIKIFDLTQYAKVVFLDTDMIILQNLDHLFTFEHMSASDAGAVIHPEWKGGINSGLMVVQPDHSVYQALIACIEPAYRRRKEQNLGFGDQDILKAYYTDWAIQEHLHLPECYNTMLGYAGCLRRAGMIKSWKDIKVYHFTGKEKPWSKGLRSQLMVILKILKRAGIYSGIDLKIYRLYRKQWRAIGTP